ncbi:AAA family ATPase [Nostoc sp. CHAB 5836]|uniref:AAA family ATPase n=1 Tax=Nostoc sp. CHAB 5836 TaxID=2780404 RepID=UPI001E326753|nr:ATP-binding protein [Nostoc sp. CHAB 5836]MCC5614075.1 AAA family ATPase [Nostoc sp. CHAB 5836]
MKIESISIQNFKRFDNLPPISFKHKTLQEVSDQFLILGDNGSGKTTILQAIALPLSLATKKIQKVSDFNWIGFLASRYWRWGIPHIELEISFVDEEISATKEVAEIWYNSLPEYFQERRKFVEPGDNKILKLVLDGEDWQVGNREEDRLQFLGRNYVQKTFKKNPAIRSKFAKLPGVFWFDQYRLKTSDTGNTEDGKKDDIASIESIASLRPYLLDWTEKRKTPNYNSENDYYLKLENYYKRIFKGRSFAGLEPSTNQGDEPFFVLNDENRTYDIVEMSGGEYSVFPILYEFVRQQIAYSIVLIDELDLNLHPPLAQFFVNQLPKLSPTSQFIFTTHSEAVTEIIGNDEIYRLKGGKLCL